MLFFIGTRFHSYTLDSLLATGCGGTGVWIVPISYDELFAAPVLPGGTYVFTDVERLSAHECRLAAAIYRAMAERADMFHLINDPARTRTRYGLLRALYEAGVNGFDVYRANSHPRPRQFPVFIKAESNHDAAVSDLLHDQPSLDLELARLEDSGQPLGDLVVIEFAGEPVGPGLWVRYTAFRVGDDILLDLPVTESHWMVKYGEIGLGNDTMYERHDAMIRTGEHAGTLRRAFDAGRIEFGRVDFGLVGGRPQIYEINTNPNVPGLTPLHPSPVRQATREFTWERLTQRIAALATPHGSGMVFELDLPPLREYRERSNGGVMAFRP